MASIVDDDQYVPTRRRQRMISELSHMGVDDDALRDEIMKVRAHRARTHSSPTPRPKSSIHVGRVIDARQKQGQTPRAERRRLLHEDRSITRARPSDSSPVRSPSRGLSNRSHASPSRSSTKNARNAQASKDPGIHSKRDPWITKEDNSRVRSGRAATQDDPHAIALSPFPHSNNTEYYTRKRQVSKPSGMESQLLREARSERLSSRGCAADQDGPNAIGLSRSQNSNSAERMRNKQFSKPPGIQSKFICQTSSEGLVCPACIAKYGGSNALGSNSSRRSKSPAHMQNKQVLESPDMQSTLTPKMRMSRLLCLGSTAKQDGSNEMESDFPVDSKRIVNYEQIYQPRGIQSRSHALHQESIARKDPRQSRRTRSLSNAMPGQNHVSLASTKNSISGRGVNRRNAAAFLHENGSSGRFQSTADRSSTLSLPRTWAGHERNSIIARNRLNRVYPGGRYYGPHYADGDDSSQDLLHGTSEMGEVVDSIRSSARDILRSDVEDIWLTRAVLKGIAESKKVSVDTLIESLSEKLDDLEDTFFGATDAREEDQARSCFPKVQLSVNW